MFMRLLPAPPSHPPASCRAQAHVYVHLLSPSVYLSPASWVAARLAVRILEEHLQPHAYPAQLLGANYSLACAETGLVLHVQVRRPPVRQRAALHRGYHGACLPCCAPVFALVCAETGLVLHVHVRYDLCCAGMGPRVQCAAGCCLAPWSWGRGHGAAPCHS